MEIFQAFESGVVLFPTDQIVSMVDRVEDSERVFQSIRRIGNILTDRFCVDKSSLLLGQLFSAGLNGLVQLKNLSCQCHSPFSNVL